MDNSSDLVRKGYNQLANVYHNWAEAVRVAEREKYLTKIDQSFSEGSRILDIGCGNGLLNTQRMANKFDVIGMDISERQICEAHENLPKSKFICADIQHYEFDQNSFDGIVSFYCFNHIPRNAYSKLFGKFHQWLMADGLLIASFGIGDTEGWTGEWLGTEMFFSSYEKSKTISLFKQNGFMIEDANIETTLEDGVEISFLWITARNKKP